MLNNFHINRAREQKNNEFYTSYETIENELIYYKDRLKGKKIFCNCDKVNSNFVKYFNDNFDKFQLKDFIYLSKDFRSDESIDLLIQSDIVITNPPFSLWRTYLQQLLKYNKKFIILGRLDNIKYKVIRDHICNETICLGKSLRSGDVHFIVPDGYNEHYKKNGKSYIKVPGIRWFQNLKKFNSSEITNVVSDFTIYEKYINYDAINIDKSKDIPSNYNDLMGVPLSFIDKINYNQFKIVSLDSNLRLKNRIPYARMIIVKRDCYRKEQDLFEMI